MLEIELALTKSTDWLHTAVLFDGYDRALKFALSVRSGISTATC